MMKALRPLAVRVKFSISTVLGFHSSKTGTVQRVIRPEGRVRDPITTEKLGTYYKDIGTVRIGAVDQESATARILLTCEGMLKGDIVIPNVQKPIVEFNGSLSNALTPLRAVLPARFCLESTMHGKWPSGSSVLFNSASAMA